MKLQTILLTALLAISPFVGHAHAGTTFTYVSPVLEQVLEPEAPASGSTLITFGERFYISLTMKEGIAADYTGRVSFDEVTAWSSGSGEFHASGMDGYRLVGYLSLINGRADMWSVAAVPIASTGHQAYLSSYYSYEYTPGYWYEEAGGQFWQPAYFWGTRQAMAFDLACASCSFYGRYVIENFSELNHGADLGTWTMSVASAVPENSQVALMSGGLALLALIRRRKGKVKSRCGEPHSIAKPPRAGSRVAHHTAGHLAV